MISFLFLMLIFLPGQDGAQLALGPSSGKGRGASTTEHKVSSRDSLFSAISKATGGETIVLGPGNYGNVKIYGRSFKQPVTIVSASAANRAHFDRLNVEASGNIVFKLLDIGGAPVAGENGDHMAMVKGSSRIIFDRVHVHGTLDGDPTSDRSGLQIRSSDSIRIVNSEFQQLFRGAFIRKSSNIELRGNVFHGIRCDGLAFAGSKNVLIDSNRFTDFSRQPDDHSDAIQFWTSRETTPSTDIRIVNNQILQGKGTAMQGVFMRDEGGVLPFERVLIENNLVYEADYPNAITVIGGKAVTIKGNTTVSPPSDRTTIWIRLQNLTDANVTGNVTDNFFQKGKNNGLVLADNIVLVRSPREKARLKDIGRGSAAKASGFVITGRGYQLRGSGSALDLIPGL